jgi:hypothetical protein
MLQYTILSLSYTRHRTAGKELGYYILAHEPHTTAAQRSPNTNTAPALHTPSARATRHTMVARRQ